MKKVSMVLFLLLVLAAPVRAFAYTDQIALSSDKVWKAAKEVLGKDYGIKKVKEKQMIIETKWMEDRVERSRGIFKNTNIVHEIYVRRSRFTVKLIDETYHTTVEVKGRFREKALNSGPAIGWKTVKPEVADFELERAAFMRILNNLQHEMEKEYNL